VACPVANSLTGETSAAGNEVNPSRTSQMGECECSQNSVDNSENMNHNTSTDEGSEKGKNVVEIGANRQSCDPFTMLLFKLVLEVVMGVVGAKHRA